MSTVKNITVVELDNLLQKSNISLVDVRTEEEVVRGKISQAEVIPLHTLVARLHELDKEKPTVFCCQMGGRSAQAATYSVEQGFADVYNLQGGFVAWTQAGLPTV